LSQWIASAAVNVILTSKPVAPPAVKSAADSVGAHIRSELGSDGPTTIASFPPAVFGPQSNG